MNVYYPLIKLFWSAAGFVDRPRLEKVRLRDEVIAYRDIPYCDDGRKEHLLDVYLPDDGGTSLLPVVISIHGGGWMYGSKENNLELCTLIAQRGYAVFNINYTLAPKASIGDMIEEIFLAFGFIGKHWAEYRADLSRASLCGDSAGGQLSLCAAAIANSAEVRDAFGIGEAPFGVRSLVLFSPVCFLDRGIGPVSANHRVALKRDFLKMHREHVKPAFFFEKGGVCPAFLVTSAGDSLGRRQTERLYGMYKEYGVGCLFDCAPDRKLGHIYPLFDPESKASGRVVEMMLEFLENG